MTKSTVPPELVWSRRGLQVSCPAYTAVELASGDDGGAIIDLALHSRMATLDEMLAAMRAMPNRVGNRRRSELLRDSRDAPWSELERIGHRLLRQRRISGWTTNAPINTRAGRYHADVLFRRARLIVEFDGWEFHSDRDAFENDRRRRNELVLAGYTVLNFTWKQVTEDPEWVADCILRALD
jgi:very-short-patch-repair endonuclease